MEKAGAETLRPHSWAAWHPTGSGPDQSASLALPCRPRTRRFPWSSGLSPWGPDAHLSNLLLAQPGQKAVTGVPCLFYLLGALFPLPRAPVKRVPLLVAAAMRGEPAGLGQGREGRGLGSSGKWGLPRLACPAQRLEQLSTPLPAWLL